MPHATCAIIPYKEIVTQGTRGRPKTGNKHSKDEPYEILLNMEAIFHEEETIRNQSGHI